MRFLAYAVLLAVSVGGTAAPLSAAPCKDARGKFMKCPSPPTAGARCRKDGKFAKCGTPGAVPVKK